MSDTNVVVLKGRLTRNAELTILPGGTPLTTLSIAVGENRLNKSNNEWENIPHFFEIKSFGKYAQTALSSLTKGREILITGRLQQSRWEKDGQKFSRVQVLADTLEILREPKGKAASDSASQTPPPEAPDFGAFPDSDSGTETPEYNENTILF